MTPQQAAPVIDYLAAKYRARIEPREAAVWAETLAPFDPEVGWEAVRQVSSHSERFPAHATVRAVALQIRERQVMAGRSRLALEDGPEPDTAAGVRRAELDRARRLVAHAASTIQARTAVLEPTPAERALAEHRRPVAENLPPCPEEDHSRCGTGPLRP